MTILHQGGAPGGKLFPGSHKSCELGHTVIRHFSRGDKRIREVIPVPDTLQKEAQEKSTLKYINIHSMKIGQTHSVWSSLESTVTDVRKGITKSRMLTGTYLLQSYRNKFNNSESAICKCCGTEIEDIIHVLLECPALFYERKGYFEEIRALIVKCIGAEAWQSTFNTKDKLVSLILDFSSFVCLTGKRELTSIEKADNRIVSKTPPSTTTQVGSVIGQQEVQL